MTVVVTGANGHVGANLVRMLQDQGQSVRAVVHNNTDALDELDVEVVRASVFDQASLEKAFARADTVCHLVAKISIMGDPDGSVAKTNVLGARNAARAALQSGVRKYVHVSSVHAFDLGQGHPVDERTPKSGAGSAAYDASKAQGEHEVRKVIAKGLHATIVNPTGIIGPFDYAPSRMGDVFLQLARRQLPALVQGGFDWVDVRDVGLGIMAAAERGQVGHNYLLGGHFQSISELARMASQVTGVAKPRLTVPAGMAMLGVPFARWAARDGEPKYTKESILALKHAPRVSHEKARRELGHEPRPTLDTVRDIYDWFAYTGRWIP